MVILDNPYASDMLLDWLEETQHPVLRNGFSERLDRNLNLIDEARAIEMVDAGERVFTNSENALSWLCENTHNADLIRGIEVFKDKAAMRRALKDLNPDLLFKEASFEELKDMEFDDLPDRFVLKPSVGFCSMGVYVIENEHQWNEALRDIEKSAATWNAMYPEAVVDSDTFIIEGYIQGQEYAIDAFFDAKGTPHILNVLKHDFASDADTSDRMYTTSQAIMHDMKPRLTAWLEDVNEIFKVRNFPVHIEVRVDGGHIIPIEFNPLRFAGLGGTDVSQYAYGFKTYEAYLTDTLPDDKDYQRAGDHVFTMSLLNPPSDTDGTETFDYEAFEKNFSHIHEMRAFDAARIGSYGFLFIEVDSPASPELDFILTVDLHDFITSRSDEEMIARPQ